ncbi:GtrA family protein [Microbacterium hydrocarbonoxydans]|uniref:GtrA family protein n=1 Tax=Microbacterium hydrocarbonoxydans TaxID=273678 RepID=UPI003D9858A4
MVDDARHRPRSTWSAAWRFLIVGGVNTLVTTALLIALSYVLEGWVAYTLVFVAGLAFSTFFAARWVFTSNGSRRAALAYALSYLVIYFIGLLAIAGIRALDGPEYLNGLSVLVTAPLGFVAGRIVFRERQREESTDD